MSEHPFDAETRRRRLDDLFADEPYLSTTMKARRLHEKLQELREQDDSDDASSADVAPHNSAPADNRYAGQQSPDSERLTLARAAQYLRTGGFQGEDEPPWAGRLLHFREELLMKWLAFAPERESN